jgi:hypothetical protein
MAQPVQVADVEIKADSVALNVGRSAISSGQPKAGKYLLPRLGFSDGLPELSV